MFGRLGGWCHDHRWIIVGLWLVVLAIGGATLGAVGTESRSEFSLPNVESRQGLEILEDRFGGAGAGQSGSIVFEADQGVEAPSVQQPMQAFFDDIAGFDGVADVSSPYGPQGAAQIARQGELAGQVAFARIELEDGASVEKASEIRSQIDDASPDLEDVRIEVGGAIFAGIEAPSSEILGLAFAIVILILSFGSVLAMGLPIGVALGGIGVGTIGVGLLSQLVTVPDFATTLGVMIGLGVGIDYALFIVTRFREDLHHGGPGTAQDDGGPGTAQDDGGPDGSADVRRATVLAADTAGRAVAFAGTTVVISLLGMLLMQISFITGLAIGAALVVAMTMVASLTLLPALLGLAGTRVEITRVRGLAAAALLAIALVGAGLSIDPLLVGLPLAVVVLAAGFAVAPLRREVPRPAPKPIRETKAFVWSRFIQRHPWGAVLGGTAVLIIFALPVFGLRLGFSDEGNFPKDTTTRQAYDLLARGFGPGYNGPLLLVTELGDGTDPTDIQQVTGALNADEGVALAAGPIVNDAGNAAQWNVIPTTAPQNESTTELVQRLRDDVLPTATESTDADVLVTGSVAVQVDFTDYLGDRLLIFFAAVLGLSFLLLMAVFRSVLVPLKAVVMNLLSIGAAYGVLVAVFQWGWGTALLGIESAPIEPFLPMMLFAIVFGLSMDYEVFLLSRVREEYIRTGDSHTSVADGLAATARVITAAAAIMVFIFSSFLLESDRIIKLFGFGLGFAVLLDATLVRMLLVPATMELLGDRNWWLPRWLDRILPTVDVEGQDASDDDGDEGGGSGIGGDTSPQAPRPGELEPVG